MTETELWYQFIHMDEQIEAREAVLLKVMGDEYYAMRARQGQSKPGEQLELFD